MNQIVYKVNDKIYKSQGVGIISKTGPKDNRSKSSKQHLTIIDYPYNLTEELPWLHIDLTKINANTVVSPHSEARYQITAIQYLARMLTEIPPINI
jgi:hypothetical protein